MDSVELSSLRVLKELSYDSLKVELLEVPLKTIYNRNIIAKSLEGDIIWQVEDVFKEVKRQDSPFVNIEYYDDAKLIAYNFIGAKYYIYLKTGELELVYKKLY